jgi:tRNA threonylcarbamoyladenosine biosynthesis protein TsaE
VNRAIAFHLRTADETEQLGAVLGDLLRSREAHPGAVVILLSGDLGAGKTTFTRGLAEGLGARSDAVASPTFMVRMDHRGERNLAHLDAWRLEADGLEGIGLEGIGLDELLAGDGVVAIEWPERIASALPKRNIRIRLEHSAPQEEHGDAGRTATIDAGGLGERESARLLEGLRILVRAPRISPPACPVCGRPPAGESATDTPFCSARCRVADLGDWLFMRHRIVGWEQPEFDE